MFSKDFNTYISASLVLVERHAWMHAEWNKPEQVLVQGVFMKTIWVLGQAVVQCHSGCLFGFLIHLTSFCTKLQNELCTTKKKETTSTTLLTRSTLSHQQQDQTSDKILALFAGNQNSVGFCPVYLSMAQLILLVTKCVRVIHPKFTVLFGTGTVQSLMGLSTTSAVWPD